MMMSIFSFFVFIFRGHHISGCFCVHAWPLFWQKISPKLSLAKERKDCVSHWLLQLLEFGVSFVTENTPTLHGKNSKKLEGYYGFWKIIRLWLNLEKHKCTNKYTFESPCQNMSPKSLAKYSFPDWAHFLHTLFTDKCKHLLGWAHCKYEFVLHYLLLWILHSSNLYKIEFMYIQVCLLMIDTPIEL